MSNETNKASTQFRTYGGVFGGFAAGVLLTLIAVNAASPGAGDVSAMVGSMIAGGSTPAGQGIGVIELDGDAVSGKVGFSYGGGTVRADFNIDSKDPVMVRVELPRKNGVSFAGLAAAADQGLPPAHYGDDLSEISFNSSGQRQFVLYLSKDTQEAKSFKVSFVQNHKVIREETVELPQS